MAHPKPFIINTPPPSPEATARRLQVSAADMRWLEKMLKRLFAQIKREKKQKVRNDNVEKV